MLLLLFWMCHLGYLASSMVTSLLMHSRLLCGRGFEGRAAIFCHGYGARLWQNGDSSVFLGHKTAKQSNSYFLQVTEEQRDPLHGNQQPTVNRSWHITSSEQRAASSNTQASNCHQAKVEVKGARKWRDPGSVRHEDKQVPSASLYKVLPHSDLLERATLLKPIINFILLHICFVLSWVRTGKRGCHCYCLQWER